MAASIQLAVLAAWVVLCARFIAPFFFPVIWAGVLATAVWPLVKRFDPDRPKTGATVFVAVALARILVPSWLLFEAVATSIVDLGRRIAHGEFKVPPRNERVLSWPLVGQRLYVGWTRAVETPNEVFERFIPQPRMAGRWLIESAGHPALGCKLAVAWATGNAEIADAAAITPPPVDVAGAASPLPGAPCGA